MKWFPVPVNHRPRTQGISGMDSTTWLWVGIVDHMFGVAWLQRRARVPAVERIVGGEKS